MNILALFGIQDTRALRIMDPFPHTFRTTVQNVRRSRISPILPPHVSESDYDPLRDWNVTPRSVARYLRTLDTVYASMGRGVSARSVYRPFRSFPIDRSLACRSDLQTLWDRYGSVVWDGTEPHVKRVRTYPSLLETYARDDPPSFLCHVYVFSLGHVSGTPWIEPKVRSALDLDPTHRLATFENDPTMDPVALRRAFFAYVSDLDPDAREPCLREAERAVDLGMDVLETLRDLLFDEDGTV